MRNFYLLVCICVLGCGPDKASDASQVRLQKIAISYVGAHHRAASQHAENKEWFERFRAGGYTEELKAIEAAFVELHAAAAIVATIQSRLPPKTDDKWKRMSASAVKAYEDVINDYEAKRNKYHTLSETLKNRIQTNEKRPQERE